MIKVEKIDNPINNSSTDCSSTDPKSKLTHNFDLKLSNQHSNDDINDSLNSSLHLPQINSRNVNKSKSLPRLIINTRSNHSNKDIDLGDEGGDEGEIVEINRYNVDDFKKL